MTANTDKVVQNPAVYYSGTYWNDYEVVRNEMNRRVSGDPVVNWHLHFLHTHRNRRFRKALILCCGNGWVERDLYRTGLFTEAVGVDYLQPLLDEAIAKAAENNMPLCYYKMDINTGRFPDMEFDLVINHAACHHIAYLDKVLRAINAVLDPNGYFVNFDYVGPHRNQYPYNQWSELHRLNDTLPHALRQELSYPHLPTMLANDPTEAIHSELILEFTRRYFHIEEHTRVGGALAYPLLTHNRSMKGAQGIDLIPWIKYLLEEDWTFTLANPDSSLFDYFACTPNKGILDNADMLHRFEQEEIARENDCLNKGGLYYPLNVLQKLHLDIDELRNENRRLRGS